MIDGGNTEKWDIILPDNPPNIVVVRVKSQANALARCIYVYRCTCRSVCPKAQQAERTTVACEGESDVTRINTGMISCGKTRSI
jgi:hypothetical protein